MIIRVQRQSLHERFTADHGSDIPVVIRILGETVESMKLIACVVGQRCLAST
jgi:hypothetical protein